MTDNVIGFTPRKATKTLADGMAEELDDLAKRIRAGEITAFAIAAVHKNNDEKGVMTAYHVPDDWFHMVSAVTFLQRELLDLMEIE